MFLQMTNQVYIALAVFSYCSFALFAYTSPRRASATSMVLGILFLPIFELKISHVPPITKFVFIGVMVTALTFLFDRETWRRFKLRAYDLPVLLWCSSSLFSSLENDLGLKDGMFETGAKLMQWAVPYFIGRAYFAEQKQSRNLVLGVFVGGLLYIPFCLFEIKFSPQLHRLVYGYFQHSFSQVIRFDGYRPMVFMSHGLMVGLWMSLATLSGFWLWKLDLFRKNERTPAKLALLLLVVTTIAIKSTGALLLLCLGIGILCFEKVKTLKYLVLAVSLAPLIYIPARTMGYFTGRTTVDLVANYLSPERAYSLAFRLANEEKMIRKTMEKPLFGWGGWGRGRVYDEEGNDITVTDSLWVIAFSTNGFWGVFWLFTMLCLPAFLFARSQIIQERLVASAPIAVIAVSCLLYVLDSVLNNMPNPVYLMMVGCVNGMVGNRQREVEKQPVVVPILEVVR